MSGLADKPSAVQTSRLDLLGKLGHDVKPAGRGRLGKRVCQRIFDHVRREPPWGSSAKPRFSLHFAGAWTLATCSGSVRLMAVLRQGAVRRVEASGRVLKLVPEAETGRPFLKWAGGKRQLLGALLDAAPRDTATYFEPFLGGGALFFALQPKRAVLADVNARLIRTYRGVRNNVEEVIRQLKGFKYTSEFYYRFRERDIDAGKDPDVAAWFIYLNKTGFNGLYRVNRDNRFNVPFGRYVNPTICDEDTLRACSAALLKAELLVEDFASVVKDAGRGDFVYFDPPYVPLSATANFTSYTSRGFDIEEQTRLRDTARKLKKRGVRVLLSNSSAPSVRELYADGFEVTEVSATRLVNSKASARGAIVELLIQ